VTLNTWTCQVIVYDFPVSSSPQRKAPLKKPKWVHALHKRQPLIDMETVILSINCASAAKLAYKKLSTQDIFFDMVVTRRTFELSINSLLQPYPVLLSTFKFSNFLKEEKASLQRHTTWSAIAVELVLGNLIGLLPLLFHTRPVCSWIFHFAKEFTNDDILQSGCVWLMGVPASCNCSSLGNHICVLSPNSSFSSFVEAFQVNNITPSASK
ncbi:unnamed protein product, partial [Brassica oleracea var. botrytis]